MAAGLPVVAFLHTASDGHRLILDAQCGVSANSGDLDQCVAVMQNLMAAPSHFDSFGLEGQRYALENFSKEVCVSQLIEMLATQH
jgi:glycosyltransferase involved in cell wall biosynthesis